MEHPADGRIRSIAAGAGAQQQMVAVSRWQPTEEAEQTLKSGTTPVFCRLMQATLHCQESRILLPVRNREFF